ncbi:uncharacterized protein LOC131145238 [Malania oleifera]|uniref:uncharacterized protein LOC131145238 n=1 Tax=Malania oleifera TaxID=397392 RepID=UPI0025AE9A65|nr:uncharacterized protein LOC131145238 [Malania oleifera]
MTTTLTRGVQNLTRITSYLRYCFFSSLSPSSSSSPSSGLRAAGGSTDVAGDDLLFAESTPSPAEPVIPSLIQPRVVVYDGVCHLCHKGVKWVINADKHKKIKFCCVQSKAAEPYMKLCGVDREDVLRRFLFIEGLGLYHQGSTAALRVLSYLPLPYSALSSFLIIPTPARDVVYDYIAKRRYNWFGKEEDCLVLRDEEMLERFIDRDELFGRKQSDL